MVFGFNNFNMMNMFPMNFGSFGFGSFGCGTGYSNFGSSLWGCGFGNNYLNPVNCNGSTNWGSVGFGLFSTFAPVLFAGVTRLVAGASQNSNSNQQEVVAEDIQVLQGRVDDALAELGSGVTVDDYQTYSIDKDETELLKNKNDAAKNLKDATDRISALEGNGSGSISSLENAYQTLKENDPNEANQETINAKKAWEDAKAELADLKEKVAPDGELYKADQDATKVYKDRAEAIRLQKIKIEKAIEELKKAQAELDELVLDKADGTRASRTRAEEFNKLITEKDGKLTFNTDKNIDDVKRGDLQYILAQFSSTKDIATKQKWGSLFKEIYNNTQLDGDLRTGSMEKAYDIIEEFLKNNPIKTA